MLGLYSGNYSIKRNIVTFTYIRVIFTYMGQTERDQNKVLTKLIDKID